ncbi:MAG: histidine phosphatase family protein [Candidatus Micrarchaeota archaeon]
MKKSITVNVFVSRHGEKIGDAITSKSAENLRKKWFKQGYLLETGPVIIFHSPAERARQTAQAISAGLKQSNLVTRFLPNRSESLTEAKTDAEIAKTESAKGKTRDDLVLDYVESRGAPGLTTPTREELMKKIHKDLFRGLYDLLYAPNALAKKREHEVYNVVNVTHSPNLDLLKAFVLRKTGKEFTRQDLVQQEEHLKLVAKPTGIYFNDRRIFSVEELKQFLGLKPAGFKQIL